MGVNIVRILSEYGRGHRRGYLIGYYADIGANMMRMSMRSFPQIEDIATGMNGDFWRISARILRGHCSNIIWRRRY